MFATNIIRSDADAGQTAPRVAILDPDYRVLAAHLDCESETTEQFLDGSPQQPPWLTPGIMQLVRLLTESWSADGAVQRGMLLPPNGLLRVFPLHRSSGWFIGVLFDTLERTIDFTSRASEHRISPRELEVLRLILDGLGAAKIAERLHISESTAHGHIRRLLEKTGTKNRAHLAAKMLGWGNESPPTGSLLQFS